MWPADASDLWLYFRPDPSQLSDTDVAVPMGCVLLQHPEVGEQLWRLPQGKGT